MSEDQLLQFASNLLISFLSRTKESLLESYSEKVADKINSNVAKLNSLVKDIFKDNNKERQYEEFESNPEKNREIIENELHTKFKDDPNFKKTLIDLIKDIQNDMEVDIQMKKIRSNSSVKGARIDEIKRGHVRHIMEDIDSEGPVEGPTINKIG
jgi:hypothetical protein